MVFVMGLVTKELVGDFLLKMPLRIEFGKG